MFLLVSVLLLLLSIEPIRGQLLLSISGANIETGRNLVVHVLIIKRSMIIFTMKHGTERSRSVVECLTGDQGACVVSMSKTH